MIDLKDLVERLKQLKGRDFEECERAERASGNYTPVVQYSTSFLVRLGARALGVNVHDLKDLPLNEYSQISVMVSNFLLSISDAATTSNTANAPKTQSESSDNQQ